VILQLGSVLGNVFGQVLQAAAPLAVQTGQFFLQRELQRVQAKDIRKQQQSLAIQGLNAPGISVATLGGTTQPVGGQVQRSTFLPARQTPAQNPLGNIPLLPARNPPYVTNDIRQNPAARVLLGAPPITAPAALNGNGRTTTVPVLNGNGPKFAVDEYGKTIKFVPSPRPGEGFITVNQARQLGLSPTKPYYRFNRANGLYEKMKARKMNPLNFSAKNRAERRLARFMDTIKGAVSISTDLDRGVKCKGKTIRFKKKRRKRCG
jgi:hypothetical protein